MSAIVPTIGRKVYFYENTGTAGLKPVNAYDVKTPYDATIIYVWGPNCVNLAVTAHNGVQSYPCSVPLRDPSPEDGHNGYYATWMPFQVGQAKAAEQSSDRAA